MHSILIISRINSSHYIYERNFTDKKIYNYKIHGFTYFVHLQSFHFLSQAKKNFFLTNRYFIFLIVILVKLFLLLLIQTLTKNVTC